MLCEQDIGRLEDYVDQSGAVLLFLSRGYFTSRNALREIRSASGSRAKGCERRLSTAMAVNRCAARLFKPLVLVHEASAANGGHSVNGPASTAPPRRTASFVGGLTLDESRQEYLQL